LRHHDPGRLARRTAPRTNQLLVPDLSARPWPDNDEAGAGTRRGPPQPDAELELEPETEPPDNVALSRPATSRRSSGDVGANSWLAR
jgi:hypothetical protein